MKGLALVSSSPSVASPSLLFSNNSFLQSRSGVHGRWWTAGVGGTNNSFPPLKFPYQQLKVAPFICLSSTNSSSIVEQQQDSPPPPTPSVVESVDDGTNEVDGFPLNFSGCKACGKTEIESGCDGDGRIQGGIATIPGFGWWPIKAYRPCPGFVASGGNYKRRGQSMDEVASGRGRRVTSIDDSDEFETRKKGKNRKQFKG